MMLVKGIYVKSDVEILETNCRWGYFVFLRVVHLLSFLENNQDVIGVGGNQNLVIVITVMTTLMMMMMTPLIMMMMVVLLPLQIMAMKLIVLMI